MSSFRAFRALWVLGLCGGLALTGPATALAGPPKPAPLAKADSWVGGKDLISSKVLVSLPPRVPAPPTVKATSWLIADLDTRQILAGRRMHVPMAPASTLKIFTALALAHRLDPAAVYTGRDDDAAVDGTKVGIVPGSIYTVNDLLHGMLMASGNDCANALGNEVGGKAKAVALIQQEAQSLGAFDTVPRTTNGLDAPGQVSSAYDLALAGSAALQEPQLTAVMQTKLYHFPANGKTLSPKRKRFEIQSHDHLLWNYKGATGVKNGYTIAARGSFVGSATRGGHSYIAVVMRAEGQTWRESAALLDWAFAHGSQATSVGSLVTPGQLPAKIGPGLPDPGPGLGTDLGTDLGTGLGAGLGTPAASATPGASEVGAGSGAGSGGSGAGAAGSGSGSSGSGGVRGALPATRTSLTSSSPSTSHQDVLWLGTAVIALLLLALGLSSKSRLSRRTPTPTPGKHRG